MFRFSKFGSKASDLKNWEKWFASRGIKTEINHTWQKGFALYREGTEAESAGTAEYRARERKSFHPDQK